MTIRRCVAGLAILAFLSAGHAQDGRADNEAIALGFHKLTGEPLDFLSIAERSEAVRRAANFDRPEAIKLEAARLKTQLAAADPARELTIRVNNSISQYDHDSGEFSVSLFSPGHYVPVQAYGQEYQLVFSNAESVRPIPMPKDEARAFDAQLNRIGRSVSDEIHFKITGKGDPTGGVGNGGRVIRAEILSVRLLDPSGRVLFTPKPVPYESMAKAAESSLDLAHADVAGLRVGSKVKDLEATATRLFGPSKRKIGAPKTSKLAGVLLVNSMKCTYMADGRHDPVPGAVCVTAWFDSDEIVRSITIERIFRYLDPEVFRKLAVKKYGQVASSAGQGRLGWGPEVDLKDGAGSHRALTANYATIESFASRSGNRIPEVCLTLQLVDAQWLAGQRQ